MSSRRKRAPPSRVDEEATKRLNWNMLADRRNETEAADLLEPVSLLHPDASSSSCSRDSASTGSALQAASLPGTSADTGLAPLAVTVLPVPKLSHVWTALVGEFRLRPAWLPHDGERRTLTLHRRGRQLCLRYGCTEEDEDPPSGPDQETCPVDCSLTWIGLEDVEWLQRRRVLQLCFLQEDAGFKVGIYLLEAALSPSQFLSEGSARLKKANLLLQKMMEFLYDFIIPDVAGSEEEECDTDHERQNIEELYDYVRHQHQMERHESACEVQHQALVPVLRPYQRQAVGWMLRREKSGASPAREPTLHLLWRELITLCGKKLFYNPFTGCLTRDFPAAGVQRPGGILADEMGLGKTVEVLALILLHGRQDLEQEGLKMPAGKSVNYFVPPPPPPPPPRPAMEKKVGQGRPASQPKARTSYPSMRIMLLTAVKEMGSGAGGSVAATLNYIRATFGYDLPKNCKHIRKNLAKLIDDGLLERVKGRGFAGSLRLGKNYRDELLVGASKLRGGEGGARRTCGRRAKEKAELALLTSCDQISEGSRPGAWEEERAAAPEGGEETASPRKPDPTSSPSSAPEEAEPAALDPFHAPDYRFECICGERGVLDRKARVQCLKCQLWQHAHCVNYKPESLETTPFYCPHCLVAMTPVSTGATLIISPSSICHQWVEEIRRHIRSSSLRVLVYQGVKKHGFIQPQVLAQQDVVITTYDVLRSELNYVDIPHSNSTDGRRFRRQKRYMAVPSPLVAVEWWRICLDEAQMVECPTAKAAEMALRLASVNHWCVSGTPVQRGLEDLYGLFLFLGVDPYWVKHWWEQLLYRPYRRGNTEPLYGAVAQLLWRSAKKDVLDQIQIPPQTEEVHWLHFSPVEGHFYHRQHEVCSQDALLKLRKISDWSLKLGSLDRRTVHTILCPLLRLRQACCHPQAVRGEFLPLQKSTMTMEELLKSLQKKCRVECEEAHRQLVCALNGLAGIHIIRDEFVEAAEMYREVLRSSEEHKGRLKTDSLQRLHATHNLMELLRAKHPGIPPTLRDDRLSEEAEQLRQHYMTKYDSEVADALHALQPVLQNIKELKRKIKNFPWWLDVIEKAIRCSTDEDLVSRVKNELTYNFKKQDSKLCMAEKFHDAHGLQLLLTTQMEDLMKSQKTVREAVKNLEGPASREVIEEATVCHLRPMRLPLNSCVFCKADELFTDYESKLFSHTVKGQTAIFEEMIEDEDGLVDERLPTTSRGLWAASDTERTLKAVLAFAKAKRLEAELVGEGSTFMELFETWKKEYKVLHEYWMVLRNHVSAIDELGMATDRLRLRLPDEPKQKLLHIIEPHEVEQNRVKLLNDQAVAKSQLQKKLGQFLYLNNLEKSQDKSVEELNPEPCPICARPLGQEWAVLTCGHCFCNECIAIMVEQYSVGSRRRAIKCAICRQTTSHAEISYVFTTHSSSQDQDIPVKGSHSTKVEAVVRTLKKIQLTDPGAKCLVFSTWQSVLDIIAKALFHNSMDFSQINGIHKFQENLSSFKHEEKINILLLPLHTGSNGLNIIEATHVLLVEPILNPAHELQAIGRVHRIGQTRPTFVHRFLIKATIEERMQAMLKTAEKSHSSSAMKHSEASVLTVADLADLFTEDPEPLE